MTRPVLAAGGLPRKLAFAGAVAYVCYLIGRYVATGDLPYAALWSVAPVAVFVFLYESRHAGEAGHPPLGVIILIVALPLYKFISYTDRNLDLVWQMVSILVIALYVATMAAERREVVIQSVVPLAVAFASVFVAVVLSLIVSGTIGRDTGVAAVTLGLSAVFLVAGALLREWAGSAERASYVLVGAGMLQLPIVLAQATGLTRALGSGFQILAPDLWGGLVGSSSLVRYPGSFGDVELFAEWLGVLTIIAIGGVMWSGRGRTRVWLTIASAALVAMGLLTGTRAYLVALIFGMGVVVPAALLGSRGRRSTGRPRTSSRTSSPKG
jgi:hypothetical protein